MVLDENADGYVRGEGAAVLTIQAYQPQVGARACVHYNYCADHRLIAFLERQTAGASAV